MNWFALHWECHTKVQASALVNWTASIIYTCCIINSTTQCWAAVFKTTSQVNKIDWWIKSCFLLATVDVVTTILKIIQLLPIRPAYCFLHHPFLYLPQFFLFFIFTVFYFSISFVHVRTCVTKSLQHNSILRLTLKALNTAEELRCCNHFLWNFITLLVYTLLNGACLSL